MFSRLTLCVLSLTLITSCGFRPRGELTVSPALAGLSIEGGDSVLNQQLREKIDQQVGQQPTQQHAQQSTQQPIQGGATLHISKSQFQRSTRSMDAEGIATGYDYSYTIDYSITAGDGTLLQSPATIYQHRTLDYDRTQALQVEQEEAFLKTQMEQEIVVRLLTNLNRIIAGS